MPPPSGADQFKQLMNSVQSTLQTVLRDVSAASQIANISLRGFIDSLNNLAAPIKQFVGLANPGVLTEYTRAFNALNAQFGTIFAPVLRGLSALTQLLANAFAGLSGQGKQLIIFLAGASTGIAATVTVLGVLATVIGAVTAGFATMAFMLTTVAEAEAAATFGLSALFGVIGAALAAATVAGGAAAGGIGAMALASGQLAGIMSILTPVFETFVGSFNVLAAEVIPLLSSNMSTLISLVNALGQAFISSMVVGIKSFVTVLQALAPAVESLISLVPTLATGFAQFITAIAPTLGSLGGLFAQLASIFVSLMPAILPIISVIQIITPFAKILADVLQILLTPLQIVAELFGGVMLDAMRLIGDVIQSAFGSDASSMIKDYASTLRLLLTPLFDFIKGFIELVREALILVGVLRANQTGRAPRAPLGNAPAPITGVSFGGVDELFKKAQQGALLGVPEKEDASIPFQKALAAENPKLAAEIVKGIAAELAKKAVQTAQDFVPLLGLFEQERRIERGQGG